MNNDHYAIVIGLASYPSLGDPPPANLNGPERDADAVAAWLTDPTGGGLPKNNVKVLRSSDFHSPPAPAPPRDEIQKAFLWLDGLAKANLQAGNGRKVGARLYIYAAGHGFSPRVNQGCLLAGDAAEEQFSANIFPTAWIEWLQDAEYFREFVLWMDCCMDRQVLVQPTPPPLNPIGGGAAPGGTFIGFAAPRPLKAVEKKIPEDGDQWHGVFTWNLLQGLRGAAANQFNIVTARSLELWLRQAQLGWLDEGDRSNPDVAKEPSIVVQGNDLVFARNVAAREVDVRLRFPVALTGKRARVWSARGPGPELTVIEGDNPLRLKPGLYVAEADGLRHGFSVTRAETFVLADTGDAAAQAAGPFDLVVDAQDPTADIRIIGDGYQAIDGGAGRLSLSLPFGLYQMRIRVGRQIVEKVILLDRPWPPPLGPSAVPKLPAITSAAPLPQTRATHEYQQAAAADVTTFDVQEGQGAELMVMVRCFSAGGQSGSLAAPWTGVTVRRADGTLLADLSVQGRRQAGQDPVGTCRLELAPGAYVLRYEAGKGGPVEQSLLVPKGWRLESYLLRIVRDGRMDVMPRTTLLMRRMGTPWGTAEDLRLEKARVALADERPVLGFELSELLLEKFDNPLAGILGGHLLLIAREQGLRASLGSLETVVKNLRRLVGPEHPDVEALSFGSPDEALWSQRPIIAPPLFERSWRLLVKASQRNAALVPLPIWQRVHAPMMAPPFLSWCSDPARQRTFRKALAQAAFGQREHAPTVPAPGGGIDVPSFSVSPSVPMAPAQAEALGLPPAALAALEEEYRAGT